MSRLVRNLGACALAVAAARPYESLHAQILETETARPMRAGRIKIEMEVEFQHSTEGSEAALPMVFEYGATNRLELTIEPVAYTAIRPKIGQSATGVGDLELTLTGLLRHESPGLPALAVAGEAKIPTAQNDLIGTGKADYAVFGIASRRFGAFDVHANLAYTIMGEPPGVSLNNVWSGAVAGEYIRSPSFEVYAEALGSTAAAPEGTEGDSSSGNALVPEAAGSELVGSIGVAYRPRPAMRLSLGVSYDNTNAVQVRPGIALWFN